MASCDKNSSRTATTATPANQPNIDDDEDNDLDSADLGSDGMSSGSSEYDVNIDHNSLRSLAIFQDLWHPSVYKVNTAKREGFSVFALFNCVSSIGAKRLKQIFLRPTRDAEVLTCRMNMVELFVDPGNHEMYLDIKQNMRGVKSVVPLLKRMTTVSAQGSPKDWFPLYNTLLSAKEILVSLESCQRNFPGQFPQLSSLILKMTQCFSPEVIDVAVQIERVVDFDEISRTEQFQVKVGFDEQLDACKDIGAKQPEILNEAEGRELENLERYQRRPSDIAVVYFPQVGYLLQVGLGESMQLDGIPGLRRMFTTNVYSFFKTHGTTQMDEIYGDVVMKTSDMQLNIMLELQEKVLQQAGSIVELVGFCAEIDCFLAFADAAKQHGLVKPTFNASNTIEIIEGRHLLQEMTTEQFVPNNYNSGPSKKIKIITGPNGSGKSIYIKQIALIVYLAHIGSFVPAKQASIPFVDSIFTRIKSLETVTSKKSSFMSDLEQINQALVNATPTSLVVIDEFGKGTNPRSGVSLLAATIRKWLQAETPHVLATTHFHSLATFLPSDSNQIDYLMFEVDRPLRDPSEPSTSSTLDYGDDFSPHFRIVNGRATSSMADCVARRSSIPEVLIKRAVEVTKTLTTRKPLELRFQTWAHDYADTYEKHQMFGDAFLQLNLDDREAIDAFFEN